jgi:hypothetical protein
MKWTFLKKLLKNVVKGICGRVPSRIFLNGTNGSRQTYSVSRDWYVYSGKTACVEITDQTEQEAAEICADLNICEPESDWRCAEDKSENGEIEEA